MRLDSKFENALDNLLIEIGNDYEKWSGPGRVKDDEHMKKIKLDSISRFKDELRITSGRKFMKVIHGTSVWGFVAINDGVLKGIPYKKGDTFKPAGWRAPAKHVRGSIFDGLTNWFSWTGPNYL